jgi:hypothetical protein
MSDDKAYEIEIRVRSGAAGDEAVRHLEGPLPHGTAQDVAAEIVGVLDSRSGKKIKTIPGTDR